MIGKTTEFITATCGDEDQFHLTAYQQRLLGRRCIGVEEDGKQFRFHPLTDRQQHILVTATNDNLHFMQPVMHLMREEGHLVSTLPAQGLTPQRLLNAMKFCDVAWFEWGDGAIVAASKMAKYCRIVCRIHRYELYQPRILEIAWSNVDEVVLVSEAMKQRFLSQLGDRRPEQLKVTVLPNLTEHQAVPVLTQGNAFALGCVARFAPQKNLMQLLPIMQALVKIDQRYTLSIAGRIEDTCLYESFCYMRDKLGLQDNVHIGGAIPAEQMASWYRDKSYLLSVSYHESQGMAIFEAMLAGLKPVVFPAAGGLDEYLPSRYFVTSIDEAVAQITASERDPQQYQRDGQACLQQSTLCARYTALWQREVTTHPLFTIAIPSYNRERYILPAVCSALNQRDSVFEVVVVDDGSDDNSLGMLATINDARLRIIRKAHTHAPDTRNRCIEEAAGDYLVWLDSDDLLHANALSHYRSLLHRWPEVDVISCGMETLGDQKRYFALFAHSPANWLHRLFETNVVSNPGCCVRRSLYANIGGYDHRYLRAHDYEFWSRALGRASLMFTPQCNVSYRLHDSNLTGFGKPVDMSYEHRIVTAMLRRYSHGELFPGCKPQEITEIITKRCQALRINSAPDNLLIVIDARGKTPQQLLPAVKCLASQKDKRFQLIFINDAPLPLFGKPVLICTGDERQPIADYLAQHATNGFWRVFDFNFTALKSSSTDAIALLKASVLDDECVPPPLFQRRGI